MKNRHARILVLLTANSWIGRLGAKLLACHKAQCAGISHGLQEPDRVMGRFEWLREWFRESMLAEPNECNADTNDEHAGPAAGSYSFPEEEFATERSCRVIQSGYRHDEADILDGKHG